jgi:hypothetical protein
VLSSPCRPCILSYRGCRRLCPLLKAWQIKAFRDDGELTLRPAIDSAGDDYRVLL